MLFLTAYWLMAVLQGTHTLLSPGTVAEAHEQPELCHTVKARLHTKASQAECAMWKRSSLGCCLSWAKSKQQQLEPSVGNFTIPQLSYYKIKYIQI